MSHKRYALWLALILTAAADAAPEGDAATAQTYLRELQTEQAAYVAAHKAPFFQQLAAGQHPRATVLMCADAGVHPDMLDKTPEGDLYVVRNLGNQLATSRGSVAYGVNELGSSLLLIVGHSACDAIQLAGGDYAALDESIRKELDTLEITKGNTNLDGVKTNVNNQVAAALKLWGERVKAGQLLVIGAVYDVANAMKKGPGRLNVININGETDPAKLRNLPGGAPRAEANPRK